jgi:hypothetical protein
MKKGNQAIATWGLPVLALALALWAPAAKADEPIPILVDDFTTGPDTLVIETTGLIENRTQSDDTGHILGGVRCTHFKVTDNPFNRPSHLDIRGGRLVVDNAIRSEHATWLLYGWDEACGPRGMSNLDLSQHEGLRFDFGGLDQDTAGAIVVWGGGGISSIPFGVAAGGPRHVDVRRADFSGSAEWTDVNYIAIVIQSGGAVPSHDYAIRSIWVLPTLDEEKVP